MELLKNWTNWEKYNNIATQAASKLKSKLKFLHGESIGSADRVFGLPYTSSSGFGAIWNTNTECILKSNKYLFFIGVALAPDLTPVYIFVEVDDEGDEVATKLTTNLIDFYNF